MVLGLDLGSVVGGFAARGSQVFEQEREEMEKSMLDFAENVQENSRLSCQITVSEDLDGLKVTTPESQH